MLGGLPAGLWEPYSAEIMKCVCGNSLGVWGPGPPALMTKASGPQIWAETPDSYVENIEGVRVRGSAKNVLSFLPSSFKLECRS